MNYKDLIIHKLDVNDDKVTIEEIRFKNLDYVNEGEILYSVETSKATEDYEVDFSGYVVLFVEEGGEINVGESAGIIFKDREDAVAKEKELHEKEMNPIKTINASKKAIAYAESIGFDLNLINKDGIIKTEDIDNYLQAKK